ncbi:YihY family inner membrane protein [Catenulispora sp. EB89]|uniref:YihY/virulence factor BrkB family protein n=1 Tax=Catenulispora sp. EB89 TaxID=3156257 RepID=UPI003513C196
MSTTTKVPQTRTMSGEELSADDAWRTLRRTGTGTLLRDAFLRLRYGDGFSHARALALQMALTAIPGLIALVGLAQTAHDARWGQALQDTIERVTPPASRAAVHQALENAGDGGRTAVALGLAAALLSLTLAMGQIERGANRIYGLQRDRPALAKYGGAFLRAVLAGIPIACGLALLVFGGTFGSALADTYRWPPSGLHAWDLARWPIGILLALVSAGILFRKAPRRRQPSATWLVFGAAVSLVVWTAATALLAWYVEGSHTFGATYGPLTAVLAFLLWANLSSIALFYGIAFAAQLESRRAGVRSPITADPGD